MIIGPAIILPVEPTGFCEVCCKSLATIFLQGRDSSLGHKTVAVCDGCREKFYRVCLAFIGK